MNHHQSIISRRLLIFRSLKIKSMLIISLFLFFVLFVVFIILILFTTNTIFKISMVERGKNETASFITVQTDKHIPKEIFSETDLTKTQAVFTEFFKEIDTADILRIKVWDKNGVIIASDDLDIIGKKFSENNAFQKAIKGEIVAEIKTPISLENAKEKGYGQLMEVYVPIRSFNDEIVGIIETYTILDSINNQIYNAQIDLTFKFVVLSIPLFILLIVLFWIFYKNIYYNINKLIKFTRKIGTGQFTEKPDFKHNNELSEIATALYKMGNSLNELFITKKELEEKVKRKTKKLHSKMDKVERMNNIMIGRELKIIKLKKRVIKLKGLLKNSNK